MLENHFGDELCARPVGWVVKFSAAFVRFEVGFVFPAEECALMMVEPPCQPRIARVFEVDYGVLVAVKLHVQEQLSGPMREAFINECAVFVDAVEIEITKDGGGSQSIEAIIMKINLHYPHTVSECCRLTCK